LPRFSGLLLLVLLGCAQPPTKPAPRPAPEKIVELPPLPATLVAEAECPGCQAATLTLRPDGSFLLRDRLGASEFYDFGRWRYAQGTLELAGERDTRRYALANLRHAPRVEALRGPFRMVGLYDGRRFQECRSGVAWTFADTRAADTLRREFDKQGTRPALVSLDAQLEGSPETLRIFRPATLHNSASCPT
jgi:hypothetical protein